MVGKWFIENDIDGLFLCFQVNETYVYSLSPEALEECGIHKWLEHLRPKMWFVDERGFRNKFYEIRGMS